MAANVNVISQNHVIVDETDPPFKTAAVWLRTIDRRRADAVVSFTIYSSNVKGGTPPAPGPGKPGQVSLYRDKGLRVALMQQHVHEWEGLPAALVHLVNRREGVEVAEGSITRIEMTITPQ